MANGGIGGCEALLQWGRGDDAAETTGHDLSTSRNRSLQWGRGDDAAETWLGGGSAARRESFNGAAAMMPRKPGAGAAIGLPDQASMGPRR